VRAALAAIAIVAVAAVALGWMLFAVTVAPFRDVLDTLGVDVLDGDDAFCLRDSGHWLQLLPAAAGLVAAGGTVRSLARFASGGRRPRGWMWALAFAGALVAWIVVYGYVGDCGFGEDHELARA